MTSPHEPSARRLLKVAVFNAYGRLYKRAPEADCFMRHYDIDVLLVPNSGPDSENVFVAFGDTHNTRARSRVFFTTDRAAQWSCAIVVRSWLPCSDVILSDASGRALAVDVLASSKPGAQAHEMTVLYQLTGLDNAPPGPPIPFGLLSVGTDWLEAPPRS